MVTAMRTEPITLALNGAAPDVTLHPYLLDNSPEVEEGRRHPLIILLPGGGYTFRSFREAEPVAVCMLGMGYSACIVDYAVAPAVFPTALLQVLAAIAHARQHADAWHIDPDRIVLMGFSAGGHLAASAGVFWSRPHYAGKIGRTVEEVKPNALMLGYPVITSGPFAHESSIENLLDEDTFVFQQTVSLETQVSEQCPPTFLWHTWNDQTVPVENSLLFAAALKRNNVPHALTIYPDGVHGISLANQEVFGPDRFGELRPQIAQWPEQFDAWFRAL